MAPRVMFFTTPRSKIERFHVPPDNECEIIRLFQAYGPMVNGERGLSLSAVPELNGLVLLQNIKGEIDDWFRDIRYYDPVFGRIFCLIHFQDKLQDWQLQHAQTFFNDLISTKSLGEPPYFLRPSRQVQCPQSSHVKVSPLLSNGYRQVAVIKGGEHETQVSLNMQ